ncbi:MAG: hypothetical protein KDN20_14295 [Verrucomicrobiae bacterium]|nr:hypothetical protein [Verrucomicrobiae bacterium]
MILRLILLGTLAAFSSCASPPAATPTVRTFDDDGVSTIELSLIHSFLRHLFNSTQSNEFEIADDYPQDVRSILAELRNKLDSPFLLSFQSTDLAMAYSQDSGNLLVIDKSKLGQHERLLLTQNEFGYEVGVMEGCLFYAVTINTKSGKPYRITHPDEH